MMRQAYLIALLPALLCGCTPNLLAPSGAAPKLYTLAAPSAVSVSAPQAQWQLLIDPPTAALDLDSSRIALTPAAGRIDYYADVAWVDRAPVLIQSLLVESFDRSGRIGAVQRQGGGLRSDFALSSDLQDFEIDRTGSGAAHIRMTEKLIRMRDRGIVASKTFDVSTPVSADNFDVVVAAFNGALSTILPQIVEWTLTEGAKSP